MPVSDISVASGSNVGIIVPPMPLPNVYACIAAVTAELAREGIAKERSNTAQGYKFRGIDDVYNALAPMLAKHQLVIIPRMVDRQVTERATVKGTTLFYVTLTAEFDFVSAADLSSTTVRTYGEAMDSGDKATNKAMSAAYKYAAFMTFAIPTEGGSDADASSPDAIAAVPPGFDDWFTDMLATADEGVEALKKAFFNSRKDLQDWVEAHYTVEWNKAKVKSGKVDREKKKVAAK